MINLENMINENIEFFWNNDSSIWCDDGGVFKDEPTIITEFNVKEIWSYFKAWCYYNIKECYFEKNKIIKDRIVNAAIDRSYDNWLNWQKKLYPDRVCVDNLIGGQL